MKGLTLNQKEQVDEERELTLDGCPDCGTALGSPTEVRERHVEDLLPPRAHVICYRIARYHCCGCERIVERKPDEIIPQQHLSIRVRSGSSTCARNYAYLLTAFAGC